MSEIPAPTKQKYSLGSIHSSAGDFWQIFKINADGYVSVADEPVLKMPYGAGWSDDGRPPADVREIYERMNERSEFMPAIDTPEPSVNLVEMIQDEDSDCAFDQPCRFGHRVEFHAVYCHNDRWLYAPGKCRRNRTDWKHETCAGYQPNPLTTGPG